MRTLALISLLVASPAFADGMSLKDAVNYALQHAPRLARAAENERIRGLESASADAKLYPSLDLNSTQGLKKELPSDPPPKTPAFGEVGLALTETLYDNGQTATARKVAGTNQQIARLQALQARDDVALDVTKSFYNLSLADILLQTKKQQRELLGKQFRQLVSLYRQGLKTKKDYLRFQSQVQKASIDVISAETSRRAAEIDLRRLLGAPETDRMLAFDTFKPEEALQLEPDFPEVVPPLEKSYVYRIAQLQDQSAADTVDLVRRKNQPQVTVSTGAAYQNPDYLGINGHPYGSDGVNWNVTLGLTYNLWDGGTRHRDVAIAQSQRLILGEDTREAMLSLDADIKTLMGTLANLKSTFQLDKQLMALEEENFANLESDYRQGKVAYLDLVTGLTDLLQAKVNFYATYVQILQTLAQYHYYEGTIYGSVAGP